MFLSMGRTPEIGLISSFDYPSAFGCEIFLFTPEGGCCPERSRDWRLPTESQAYSKTSTNFCGLLLMKGLK
jgi:hypothetical protein